MHHGYQEGVTNMFYKVFDKKAESRVDINVALAQELHKPERNLCENKEKTWTADLSDIELLS